MRKKYKQPEKSVITAEDAARMYAQAWPAKEELVRAEAQAAIEAIGQKHGVAIRAQFIVLPAFLVGPRQAKLPTAGA